MKFLLISILSLLPCLLWLIYFWRQDRYDREPFGTIAITFVLGAASTFFAGTANSLSDVLLSFLFGPNLFKELLLLFLIVGPVEELVKFLAVYVFAYRRPEFNEPVDGIVYSATAALGFAALENVLYAFEHGLGVITARGLLSNPGHALFAAFWGLAMSRAKAAPNIGSKRLLILAQGWFIAAMLHALFDALLTIGGAFKSPLLYLPIVLAFLGLIIGMFIYVRLQIKRMVDNSPHKEGTRLLSAMTQCENCGDLGQNNQYCIKCGHQIGSAQEQRFCEICGASQRVGAHFCKTCGASLAVQLNADQAVFRPHFLREINGETEIAFIVDSALLTVGKTLDNNFVIEDASVSKKHARIYWHESQQYFIKDLESTNGTFINGKRIAEAPLRDGCEVRLGSITLVFRTSGFNSIQSTINTAARH